MNRVRQQIGMEGRINRKIPERNITIAVLDTGVCKHPDLNGKILAFHDFVYEKKECYDDNGHGTHVCGIICGSGELSAGVNRGIMSNARLVVGKVLDEKGDGKVENMVSAIDWIIDNRRRYQIKILNISVGIGDLKDKKKEDLLREKLTEAWNKGIVVVCAAGNKGPKDNTISAIGGNSKVITVGCHDGEFCKELKNRCETYSGRGEKNSRLRKPDLVAPGTNILSCNSNFLWEKGEYKNAYIEKSGTSMATPIVSACAGMLLLYEPKLTNDEVKQRLQLTAKDLGEPWNKQGWGMIQICY